MRQYKNNITSSIRNITLISKNITPYFTGKIKIITLTSLIIILSFINITFTYALSYQTYQRLDFTFNPTLQLALSSTELTIPNLTPGASSDSNVINIGVATNTFGGLNLAATVGNSANDTTSLVSHIDNNPSNNPAFTNLSASATTLNDLPNNTWGYSYASRDTSANPDANWSNWSSYNSLIKYDDTASAPSILLDTTGTATSGEVQFKIGAKASSAQPSGTYTNVINFNATTKPLTTTYTIDYLDNTGEASSSLPPSTTDTIVADTNITLSSTIPARPGGYTFMAWCTVATSNNTCSGNIYQPGETYPISNIGEPVTINLYAMWQGPKLYDVVASKVKTDANGNPRTQTLADLQAVITVPTSNNPAEDTSNSGVYLYSGASSDVDDGYNIYYYRGILDSNLDGTENTYGSNGDGYYYPNYVRLGDTCWRIVRTTASGGTKMIYNGLYSAGTTANSCANEQTNAQYDTWSFGMKSPSTLNDWYKNINRVGYTFNNASNIQDVTASTPVETIFGDNSNYSTTNVADSRIKDYIENTWFTSTSGVSSYASILEPSAGYCNDRTIYHNASTNSMAVTEMPPYSTSGTRYFGAYERNRVNGANLSLSCPRETVDLYTTSNASNGNGQLTYPVALLTADEAALAGNGYVGTYGNVATNSSNYSYSSYLRSGYYFWLLSPNFQNSSGTALGFGLSSYGSLGTLYMNSGYGVRPSISLMHHVQITSGSGTAADPYLISAP